MLWLCLYLSYFLLTQPDEMFSADSGAVHSVHCLTRGDVAFTPTVRSWNACDGAGEQGRVSS